MKRSPNSLYAVFEHLRKTAPLVLDLATAKTEQEFCKTFDCLLERAIMHVEKNAKNLNKLDEVGLSAVLAAYFNGMQGLSVLQEGHSNGHVDLTIEVYLASPVQRRLAEAKVERGPASATKGLEQLLNRYSTGRETTGWLILYVKKAKIGSEWPPYAYTVIRRTHLGRRADAWTTESNGRLFQHMAIAAER